MKKEKRVFLNQVFLMCHLVDQTRLIEDVIPKWEGKGRIQRYVFTPPLPQIPALVEETIVCCLLKLLRMPYQLL